MKTRVSLKYFVNYGSTSIADFQHVTLAEIIQKFCFPYKEHVRTSTSEEIKGEMYKGK